MRDCESHNGTIVDGEIVEPNLPRAIYHHTVIQLGKYSFRLSLRSADTGHPIIAQPIEQSTLSGAPIQPDPNHKGMSQLLNELDELASNWNSGPQADDSSEQNAKPLVNAQAVDSAADAKFDDSDEDSDTVLMVPRNAASGDEKDHSTVMMTSAEADQTQSDQTQSDQTQSDQTQSDQTDPDSEKENQHGLPENLRPKGPKDPKNAASEALRNLFSK